MYAINISGTIIAWFRTRKEARQKVSNPQWLIRNLIVPIGYEYETQFDCAELFSKARNFTVLRNGRHFLRGRIEKC